MSQPSSLEDLQAQLTRMYEDEEWARLGEALSEVAKVGELHSRIELSLKAQTLRESLRAPEVSAPEIADSLAHVIAQVSHLSWAQGF